MCWVCSSINIYSVFLHDLCSRNYFHSPKLWFRVWKTIWIFCEISNLKGKRYAESKVINEISLKIFLSYDCLLSLSKYLWKGVNLRKNWWLASVTSSLQINFYSIWYCVNLYLKSITKCNPKSIDNIVSRRGKKVQPSDVQLSEELENYPYPPPPEGLEIWKTRLKTLDAWQSTMVLRDF